MGEPGDWLRTHKLAAARGAGLCVVSRWRNPSQLLHGYLHLLLL